MKKIALITVAAVALAISAIAAKVISPLAAAYKGAQSAPVGSRLSSYVREAKSKGRAQLTIPSPLVDYVTNVRSLHGALKYYTLVVATPTEKLTVATDDGELRTWYKLEISESLTPKKHTPCPDCAAPGLLPRDLLPLNPNQILVAERGGSLTVDGVRLDMSPEFNFTPGESYLLFLQEDQSGLFGRIMVGPDAVFKVTPDQSLAEISDSPHSLKNIVKEQYRGRLRDLRAAARQ
ncbi:MAG: hypothetical protein ABW250_18555 [Pyrinomonadaceae bacterium]